VHPPSISCGETPAGSFVCTAPASGIGVCLSSVPVSCIGSGFGAGGGVGRSVGLATTGCVVLVGEAMRLGETRQYQSGDTWE